MKLSLMNASDGLFYIRSAYSFILANSAEALEHICLLFLVYLIVCLGIYKILFACQSERTGGGGGGGGLFKDWRSLLHKLVNNVKFPKYDRVLFVIAHPDDESMFFGPTIRTLTQRPDCLVYLMCLSNGNYEKQGKKRKDELWKACTLLGIPDSNVTLINATYLPDDPNIEWKVESVAKLISNKIESLDIQALITFDRDGISHHPNHIAVYYATASLCLAGLIPKSCKIYTLDSINTIRKYMSIFDLLCTFLMSTNWCILNWREAGIVRNAMKQHKSQMKWFRRLYILFSRYMFINSLREINLSDVELEMQIQES